MWINKKLYKKPYNLLLLIVIIFLSIYLYIYLFSYEDNCIEINNKQYEIKDLLTEQWSCNRICHNLDIIPSNIAMNLHPIGNLTKKLNTNVTFKTVNHTNQIHVRGGQWMFKTIDTQCDKIPSSGVAIVIVCNDRWNQLAVTLSSLIPLLQKQNLCYRIFVIEQYEKDLINKGMMMNIGFIEALKMFKFDCVVFQDADLAPLNDLISYKCDNLTKRSVMHLGVGLDNRNFTLRYSTLIGGVLKIHKDHFVKVNGYSNMFIGWGQEDDDFEIRLHLCKIKYIHLETSIARYMHVNHKRAPHTKVKAHLELLKTARKRKYTDGLNSLNYKLISIKYNLLFTHIVASSK